MNAARAELIRKYNVPGPRYPSYPTVPDWEAAPSAEQWIAHLAHSLHEGAARGRAERYFAIEKLRAAGAAGECQRREENEEDAPAGHYSNRSYSATGSGSCSTSERHVSKT